MDGWWSDPRALTVPACPIDKAQSDRDLVLARPGSILSPCDTLYVAHGMDVCAYERRSSQWNVSQHKEHLSDTHTTQPTIHTLAAAAKHPALLSPLLPISLSLSLSRVRPLAAQVRPNDKSLAGRCGQGERRLYGRGLGVMV